MQRLCRDHTFPHRKPNAKPKLHGWLGDGNQLLLKKFIRKDTKLIFEFGTWLGKSAMFMLNQQADNPEFQKVVCVDTWEGDWSIKQTDKYKKHLANLYDTFIVNMWDVRDRVVPVRMDGRKAMKYLHGLGLKPDLIYLDMDHSYESAKGDLECLMEYFPDTLILGDDVLYWKGVAKAVKEIVKEHNLTNLEINKNCYALVPSQYCKRYRLKELVTKVIQPKEQYIDYKIGIIVGFHPRSHTRRQLQRFREHMTSFMQKTGVDYKIYVIEQHDQQQELNLGHLYNSGYEIALADGCEKFVFQDIYLLPSKALVPYYRRHNKYPIHLGYHYDKYFYEVYYLGIIMFNKENFEMVNGYPINIYGLYGWDYEMVLRIKDAGLKLKLPAEGTVIPNGTHPRINVQEWRKIKTSAIINKHSETWKSNGLKNTFYVRKPNQSHTVKHCNETQVYTVSITNCEYFLTNQDDIKHEFIHTNNCRIDDAYLVPCTCKPDPQYGYIKEDTHLIRELFEITHLGSLLEAIQLTYSQELLHTNHTQYNKRFRNSKFTRKYTLPHKEVYPFDPYKLHIIQQICNPLIYNRKKSANIFFSQPLPVNTTKTVSQLVEEETKQIQETFAFFFNRKINNKKRFSIHILYVYDHYLGENDRSPHTFIQKNPINVKDIEELLQTNKDSYNLCMLSHLFTPDKNFLLVDLCVQITIGLWLTRKRGSCVFKTWIQSFTFPHTYALINLLRNYFGAVNLIYPCTQNSRQTNVFIICDDLIEMTTTQLQKILNITQCLMTQPMQSIEFKNNFEYKLPTPSYIEFVNKLQYNFYTNLKILNEVTTYSSAKKRLLHTQLLVHKKREKKKMIDSFMRISSSNL